MEKISERNHMRVSIAVYLVLFYTVWSLWNFFGVDFTLGIVNDNQIIESVIAGVLKSVVWILPAVLLIKRYEGEMEMGLKEMFTAKIEWKKYLPIYAIFVAYLFGSKLLRGEAIAVSPEFEPSKIIDDLFVGITEEMLFRGLLLNSALKTSKNVYVPVIVNAGLFLLIHFPIWIHTGIFVSAFTQLGFVSIILLSFIFSQTFIGSRNIMVPVGLHMLWDLIMFIFY